MANIFQRNIIGSESHSEEDNTRIRSPASTSSDRNINIFKRECFLPNRWPNRVATETASSPIIRMKEKTFAQMGFTCKNFAHHVPAKKTNVMALLYKFAEERRFPSLTVKIGEQEFNVHHHVLQCYSKTFMDTSAFNPIKLPEDHVSPRAFQLIYDWMLGKAKPPNEDGCGFFELLKAATFLQVEQLIQQCWSYLDSRRFGEDKAFMLFLESKQCNVSSCHYELLTCIAKFFLQIVASREFIELDVGELQILLHSNNFGVNSELETFYAVVRWLSYDWIERKNNLFVLIECVQFGLVPPWMLVKLQKTKFVNVKRIVQVPLVRDRILDGIAFTTSRISFGSDSDSFTEQVKKMGIKLPTGREWVYDPNCVYHHKLQCNKMSEITYRDFIIYLKLLQTKHMNYWRQFESADEGPCKCEMEECDYPNEENISSFARQATILN